MLQLGPRCTTTVLAGAIARLLPVGRALVFRHIVLVKPRPGGIAAWQAEHWMPGMPLRGAECFCGNRHNPITGYAGSFASM